MIENALVGIVALTAAAILLSRRMRALSSWRATVTPLASIIGSGFLVSAPILMREVGNWAIVAIASLLVAAYIIGEAIRFNIAHVEPLLTKKNPNRNDTLVIRLERLSHFVLAFAYSVSVAYYLVLLGNFLLKGAGTENETVAKLIATGILGMLGLLGMVRGLDFVEGIEEYTVGINLAVIIAVLAGLIFHNVKMVSAGDWHLFTGTPEINGQTIQVMLGLLIVVQGFETSRFMADEFDAELRIRTMRYAQLIAAAVYLTFFSFLIVLFGQLQSQEGIAAVIGLVAHVAPVLPLMLVISAVASQFSASVADSVGSAGLVEEISHGRVSLHASYPIIATVAIGVTWSTDVFRLVTVASQAFALFYLVQCAVALMQLRGMTGLQGGSGRMVLFLAGALISLCVTVLGIPSGG